VYAFPSSSPIFHTQANRADESCQFKVHRQGDGLFVKLELQAQPNNFLCVDTDDGRLVVHDGEESSLSNCFHVKVTKGVSSYPDFLFWSDNLYLILLQNSEEISWIKNILGPRVNFD